MVSESRSLCAVSVTKVTDDRTLECCAQSKRLNVDC